jgi:ATP-binding cassette subfamily B (MDR/TAP) protein 1
MASANEKSTSPALDAAANSSPNGDIEVDNAVDAAAMNEKKASIDDAPTDSKAQPAAAAPVAAPAAAGEAAPDPFAHLPEDQATTLRRQVETPEQKYGVFHLYSYATKMDLLIILCATICSCASGAAMPAMTIIFGGLQGTFQDYISLGIISYAEFQHEIAQFVLYFVYLAVGTFFATYVSTVGFIYTGEHITTNIRQRYLESCLRQNIGFYDKLGAGEVAVKITSDANAIQDGISEKVGLLLGSVATLITGFLIGFVISWKLTLIMSATFVAMFINTALWTSCIIKSALPMTIIIAKASGLAQEMISFVRTAVAFGAQPRLATQYDKQLGASKGYGVQVKAWIAMMLAVVMGMMYLNYGLGFWQGSFFLARGELDIEDMLTTLMAVMIGSFNVGAVAPHYQAFLEAVNTASRLFVVINRDTPIDGTRDDGEKPATVEGRIQLEAVKHIYPSRPEVTVVDGVSLDFPAGKVTALVGASGSGKSTIVGLIERFYSPVAGKVLLDGRDITSLNLRWLRQKIGFVAQEPVLFSGSVYENIRYGLIGSQHEHADEQVQREMIVAAAKNANAHEFISQLTEGYDTKVGQRGFLLSGGQKQRIAIARATVSDPRSKYPAIYSQ